MKSYNYFLRHWIFSSVCQSPEVAFSYDNFLLRNPYRRTYVVCHRFSTLLEYSFFTYSLISLIQNIHDAISPFLAQPMHIAVSHSFSLIWHFSVRCFSPYSMRKHFLGVSRDNVYLHHGYKLCLNNFNFVLTFYLSLAIILIYTCTQYIYAIITTVICTHY